MRRAVLLGCLLLASASAAASSGIPWTVIAHGVVPDSSQRAPVAILAMSRVAAHRIVEQIPPDPARAALNVNYRRNVLVGVFGPFGCSDGRVRITRIDEPGRTLTVHLLVKPLPTGVASCLAVYTTYRLLVVPRSSLHVVPAAAKVVVART